MQFSMFPEGKPKYKKPTTEEFLPTLLKVRIFTVLDAKDGFHQGKPDDASSYLTTFWIPFGHYCHFACHLVYHQLQKSSKEECMQFYKACMGCKSL